MVLAICRYSCAKNTFFVIDQRPGSKNVLVPKQKRSHLTKGLCLEWFSFATDGVLFIEEPLNSDSSARWDFYNADGSTAEMCGNASRAAIHFISLRSGIDKIQLDTLVGPITGKLIAKQDAEVCLTNSTQGAIKEVTVAGLDKINVVEGYFINTGVPHFVVHRSPDLRLAEALRSHPDFGKNKTNVTFVEDFKQDLGAYPGVTLERGIEGYTPACGTGAVAAAKYLETILGSTEKVFKISMPGGVLRVDLTNEKPLLAGPVVFEFEFNLSGELYEKI